MELLTRWDRLPHNDSWNHVALVVAAWIIIYLLIKKKDER